MVEWVSTNLTWWRGLSSEQAKSSEVMFCYFSAPRHEHHEWKTPAWVQFWRTYWRSHCGQGCTRCTKPLILCIQLGKHFPNVTKVHLFTQFSLEFLPTEKRNLKWEIMWRKWTFFDGRTCCRHFVDDSTLALSRDPRFTWESGYKMELHWDHKQLGESGSMWQLPYCFPSHWIIILLS